MKKLLAILLILLAIAVPSLAAQPMEYVVDQADTFTQAQENTLNSLARAIFEKYRFDVLIVTTRNSGGKSPRLYAADFFESFRPNNREYPNGVTFSFNFDQGEYFSASRGLGLTIMPGENEKTLDRELQPYFGPKDYYEGMLAYMRFVENRLEQYSTVDEFGVVHLSSERRKPSLSESVGIVAGRYLPFILIGALAIGLGVAFFLKSRLLIAKPQGEAGEYANRQSLRLTDSSDIFLYQVVTRSKLPEKSSGSGRGGGGGGSFRSSSGGSYGGSGGKL